MAASGDQRGAVRSSLASDLDLFVKIKPLDRDPEIEQSQEELEELEHLEQAWERDWENYRTLKREFMAAVQWFFDHDFSK